MALSMKVQGFLCSGKIEFVDMDLIWMETTIQSLIILTEFIHNI